MLWLLLTGSADLSSEVSCSVPAFLSCLMHRLNCSFFHNRRTQAWRSCGATGWGEGEVNTSELGRLMGFFTLSHRFSAIHCAAAVPRTPPDAPRVPAQNPQSQRDPSAAGVLNGHGPLAAKAPPQQQRGIMGMFAAKAASKHQDTPKETKAEAKEAPGVSYLRPPPGFMALMIRSHTTSVTSATPALLLVPSPCPTGSAQ